MGFYFNQKDQVLIPDFLFLASASRLYSRLYLKSVESTDVHNVHALTWQMAGRPTQSTGSESSALCSFRSPGGSNGRIFDRWRLTGRSTGRSDRPQRLYFFGLFKGGLVIVFTQDLRRALVQFFPFFSECFLH